MKDLGGSFHGNSLEICELISYFLEISIEILIMLYVSGGENCKELYGEERQRDSPSSSAIIRVPSCVRSNVDPPYSAMSVLPVVLCPFKFSKDLRSFHSFNNLK